MRTNKTMTLAEWQSKNPNSYTAPYGYTGALIVYDHNPDLWHLADYCVSSRVGCGVVLVPA